MRFAPGPTPSEQIAFLGNIERLLSEGQFVASYKYALLIALANLAVKFGSDDGRALELSIAAIAEQFLELYWRHSAPYSFDVATQTEGVLIQNSGKQASIIALVAQIQQKHRALAQAKQSATWRTAVAKATKLIEAMPLWRLQVLRNQTIHFLYTRESDDDSIVLKPGVAANLRRFHGLIVRLVQSEWLHFVQRLPGNASLLGPTSDLGEFLFGADRAALVKMSAPLADAQSGRCLYCARKVDVGHIDHFIPWSRYPRDLAHNLVLAHRACNNNKRDILASEVHLERWLARNADHDTAIAEAGRIRSIVVDRPGTTSVAAWAYAHNAQLGAPAWSKGESVEPLTGRWRSLLAA